MANDGAGGKEGYSYEPELGGAAESKYVESYVGFWNTSAGEISGRLRDFAEVRFFARRMLTRTTTTMRASTAPPTQTSMMIAESIPIEAALGSVVCAVNVVTEDSDDVAN